MAGREGRLPRRRTQGSPLRHGKRASRSKTTENSRCCTVEGGFRGQGCGRVCIQLTRARERAHTTHTLARTHTSAHANEKRIFEGGRRGCISQKSVNLPVPAGTFLTHTQTNTTHTLSLSVKADECTSESAGASNKLILHLLRRHKNNSGYFQSPSHSRRRRKGGGGSS